MSMLAYEAAITQLFAMQARGVRMGVDRMRQALRYRRFDVHAMPYLVVAGTNGKGSVSAMLAASLAAAGYRTGLFTSPHLHRFTERVRVNGRAIGTREAARRIGELLEVFAQPGAPTVTFFELSTLLAVEAFRDHGCDVAVLEVGLGGRLDATNAFPAVVSVITRIAFDHMSYLGNTLAEIAREKAGIIKRGVLVIVGSREPEALRAITARARALNAPLQLIDRDFSWQPEARGRFAVRIGKRKLPNLRLRLAGEHQLDNAACAVAALDALRQTPLRVPVSALRAGLTSVRWPARLERIAGQPAFLLDAAHNPDGAAALAQHLRTLSKRRKKPRAQRVLVFGVMSDKDHASMLQSLAPEVDHVIYAVPQIARAADIKTLQATLPGIRARNVPDALQRAKSLAGSEGLVVVAGSIFLVAQARAHLLDLPSDPLIRM